MPATGRNAWLGLLLIARPLVLLVGDLVHPVDNPAVELFLDRDMRHRRGRRCAMPMLFARRAPDDIAGTDNLDRPAPALHEAAAGRDDERLTERMRVPITARAWLERYVGAARPCRSGCLEKLVDPYRAGEILGRPPGRGLRTVSFDVHLQPRIHERCTSIDEHLKPIGSNVQLCCTRAPAE